MDSLAEVEFGWFWVLWVRPRFRLVKISKFLRYFSFISFVNAEKRSLSSYWAHDGRIRGKIALLTGWLFHDRLQFRFHRFELFPKHGICLLVSTRRCWRKGLKCIVKSYSYSPKVCSWRARSAWSLAMASWNWTASCVFFSNDCVTLCSSCFVA